MPLPVSYQARLQATPRRRAGVAQHVVRRRLPGPVELLRADRGRARAVPEDLPGVQAAAGAGEGVAGRSAGRHRRRRSREAVRLEDRRSRAAQRHDLAARSRATSGSSTSSASTTATTASTRRSSSSATTISTRTARRGAGPGRLVRRQDRRSVAGAVEMAAKFDAMFANSSAETKTTTEKGFVEGFAKQVGDIGAIMIAISSRCCSCSAWSPPARWRSRCASAPASWPC